MNAENGGPVVERLDDPTFDRTILLARVGEAQMKLETLQTYSEKLLAENIELRGRIAVLEAGAAGEAADPVDDSHDVGSDVERARE